MVVSSRGILTIKKFEGLRLKPYLCPAGVATIGYGSTYYPNGVKVRLTDNEITIEDADYLLRSQVRIYANAVSDNVTQPLTQNQFDALTSFVYNVGIENFKRSTLLKKLNVKDYDGAAKEFSKWVYASGVVNKGLISRRTAEALLFLAEAVLFLK